MANTVNGGSHSSIESLNGSWVKLDGSFRNGNGARHSPVISEDGAMEDLLAEAVEEQSKQGSSSEKSPSGSRSSPSPPGLLRTVCCLLQIYFRDAHIMMYRNLSVVYDRSFDALCALNDRFILFKIRKVFCV